MSESPRPLRNPEEDDIVEQEILTLTKRNSLIKKALEDVFNRDTIEGNLKEFVGTCMINPINSISDLRSESKTSENLSKLITSTDTLELISGYYQERIFQVNPNFIEWKDFCFMGRNFSYVNHFELIIRSEYFISNIEYFGRYNKETEISAKGKQKILKSRLYICIAVHEDEVVRIEMSINREGREHHFENGYEEQFIYEPFPEHDCGVFTFHDEGGLVKSVR